MENLGARFGNSCSTSFNDSLREDNLGGDGAAFSCKE